jgi:transcriptional regulator with XRE-family HTH domain
MGRSRRWRHPITDDPDAAMTYDRIAMTISRAIDHLQRRHGVSRAELAKRSGLSEGGIRNLLNIRSDAKLSSLIKVFAALGYHVRYTLGPRADVHE